MVQALCSSIDLHFIQWATTVIGFLALCLMRFQIGPIPGHCAVQGRCHQPDYGICVYAVSLSLPPTSGLIKHSTARLFRPFRALARSFLNDDTAGLSLCGSGCSQFLASNSNSFYYGASHIFGGNAAWRGYREN